MGFRLVADVLDHSPYLGTEKLVHLILASHANEQGTCWPSVETIGRQAGIKPRRTQQILARMEEDGVVTRSSRPGHSSVFRVGYEAGVQPASGGDAMECTPTPALGCTQNLLGESVTEPGVKERRERKSDPLFEALATACEIDWQAGMTKTQRGRLNQAVKELHEVDARPEDIRRRARRYRLRYPQVVLTPQGLIGNWGLLGEAAHAVSPRAEQEAEWERVAQSSPEEVEESRRRVLEIAQHLRLPEDE